MIKNDIPTLGNCYNKFTPNVGNANNVRNCNPSGNATNNNNANNSNGVVPDCGKSQFKVDGETSKSVHSRKERLSRSADEADESIGTDDVTFNEGSTSVDSIKSKVCSFEELFRAAYKCKKNVMWKDSVAGYMKNVLLNSYRLHNELLNDTYTLSPYSVFVVHEKKTRTIVSTRIRDRVVQRSLCDNYLYENITKSFIWDNCACQVNKGTDMARNRLKCHLQRFYRKHGMNGYVLKVDIHDFFGSTPHSVVKDALTKRLDDDWSKEHVNTIVDSFTYVSPDKGMGLGSQITQLVQLSVLDDLDHYIKEELRIKGYVRYMDDFILIHEDKEHLKRCRTEIEERLKALELEVNQKKTYIQKIDKGIHFLGFSFRLTNTGKVLMTLLPKKISKERRKLRKLVMMVKEGKMTRKDADECYKSWRAHVSKGNCQGLLSRMDSYYVSLY